MATVLALCAAAGLGATMLLPGVTVRAVPSSGGPHPCHAFEIVCGAARPPGAEDDQERQEAESRATEAKQLARKGDRESLTAAVEMWRRASVLWRALGERQAELAALVGIGDALYRLNEYAEAETAYEHALSLSSELGDRRTKAEILTNLAANARPAGKVFEALDWLEEALTLWKAVSFRFGEAVTLSNRGILLRELGQYDAARQHYARALTMFRSLGDRRAEAFALNNLAIVLEDLNERRRALAHLSSAVRLFRLAGEPLAEGRALVSRARIQLHLGDRAASLASATHGLTLIRRSANRLAEADAVEQLGRIHAASGDAPRARAAFEDALALYRAIGSRKGESNALHDSGLTSLSVGNHEAAIELLRQALTLRRGAQLLSLEADTLLALARAEQMRGTAEAASTHAHDAVTLLERLHATVVERELRTSHFGLVRRAYSQYIDALAALHRERPDEGFAARAFEVSERARARGLIDLLRESRAGTGQTHPALLLRERQLRQELNYWTWMLWQQADRASGATETAARDRVQALLEAHADAQAELLRSNHRLAALLEATTISIADVQRNVLDDRTVLLEYALGEERSYLWAVTADRVALVDLPKRADIERRVRRFYALVSADPTRSASDPAADPKSATREAAALARILLAPVARELQRRRVLVVPDGGLSYVPFAALPLPGRSAPLASSHEIVTLPSTTVLTFLQRELAKRPPAPKLLAAFGDPVFDRLDPRLVATAPASSVDAPRLAPRRLSRLPFSRQEVNQIVALAAGRETFRALDFDADREVVTSPMLREYRYLHFATHAVRDDDNPQLSGIVLSMVGRNGAEKNGFLRLHDIHNLRLRADLVVLSACETGLGRSVMGEGLMSLARGFFYAGAARVLVTLWKVDDEATAVFMRLFYQALLSEARPSPATALRSAQAAMRRIPRFDAPFYWSGFVLEGAP